ncbi:acetyl esterase/lipase [Propionibacteriaceae bacterium ES.041]|uniref:alpha/beta hydrolase fold domain-containing protein n=1 Tax=Enemella evansiae TaxID=2016499 RepID=UPI000B970B3F|nr:alpha/beta hydrolase fold domain-containing protein [Enemella evansiae]OYN93721.1 hypothetical protein CGZ96_20170 [Enemella evansiae]PFG66716.1 acetyl esterase/lipase [Propionibacteriaceae bacterium ES.041]
MNPLTGLVDRVQEVLRARDLLEPSPVPVRPAPGQGVPEWLAAVAEIREEHNERALVAIDAAEEFGGEFFGEPPRPAGPGAGRVRRRSVRVPVDDRWPPRGEVELAPGVPAAALTPVPSLAPAANTFRMVVHEPVDGPSAGAVVVLHGGGFWMGGGSLLDAVGDEFAAFLVDRAGLTVVTPDYRLAPEHPFPRSTSDALAAVRWLAEQGFGHDRIVLQGTSSGGNCAAAAAILARTIPGFAPLAGLILSMPALDLPESIRISDDPGSRRDLLTAWAGPNPLHHPVLSPALAPALAGLPPSLVQLATDDEIARGGAEFAAAVRSGGGRAEVESHPGTHTVAAPGVQTARWESCAVFARRVCAAA